MGEAAEEAVPELIDGPEELGEDQESGNRTEAVDEKPDADADCCGNNASVLEAALDQEEGHCNEPERIEEELAAGHATKKDQNAETHQDEEHVAKDRWQRGQEGGVEVGMFCGSKNRHAVDGEGEGEV
jgi:hypothetical protein